MTDLETAIGPIIKVINRYEVNDNNNWRMKKGKLKMLMEKELPDLLKTGSGAEGLNKVLKEIDTNRDALVDFMLQLKMHATMTRRQKEFLKTSRGMKVQFTQDDLLTGLW
ncbi:EF-hand-like domain containing protein [Cricetulus griseus]|nr:EF-hand-like domain containing protein [Cricetulus griseus]